MDKPATIRSFFEKIEKIDKASTAPQATGIHQRHTAIAVAMPPAEKAEIISTQSSHDAFSLVRRPSADDDFNPDCPPLTSRKRGPAARVNYDDFGVGLPPMAGNYN